MSTATLAQGHVYHTAGMPPRSRTLSPSTLPRDPSLTESTRSRTRTEWLRSDFAKASGEIRNIHVLGIIREHLVIAFQGSGRVRCFVNNEHSLELPETNRMNNTSPFGIDWTKKYRKYLHNAHAMRFAEFEIRSLPMQVLVIGETETSEEKKIPATKPILEARTMAKILVSGYVEKQRHFPSNLGAPGHPFGLSWSGALGNVSLAEGTGCLPLQSEVKLPPATAAKYYQKLNASQKNFLGVDKKAS